AAAALVSEADAVLVPDVAADDRRGDDHHVREHDALPILRRRTSRVGAVAARGSAPGRPDHVDPRRLRLHWRPVRRIFQMGPRVRAPGSYSLTNRGPSDRRTARTHRTNRGPLRL